MRIRTRIGLVAAVVTLPQLLLLVSWDGRSRHDVAARVLAGMVDRVVEEEGAAERCLDDPEAWAAQGSRRPDHEPGRDDPGHGGDEPPDDDDHRRGRGRHPAPPTLHVFAADEVVVADGSWPGVDLAALPTDAAARVSSSTLGDHVWAARRTGWGGDCEIVAVHGTTFPGFLGSVLPGSPLWLAPILLVATVMWLAVGPVVNRVRRLTAAVAEGRPSVALEGDDEVAELSRAFDRSTAALRDEVDARTRSERELQEFVANTAHDVRIPLTVLRGHLAALERGPDPDVLAQAMVEAHYLGSLVDNLAAHARMDHETAEADVDLGEVVTRVAGRHGVLARQRGIALSWGVPETPVVVRADWTPVEQALSNLVSNAIRHHDARGHVAITLDAVGDGFRLAVLDDGPGVPPEELDRLVERGFRGDAARGRDEPGQGLGLSIVARVADRYGWAFRLEPVEPRGLRAVLES